jgi:hypothetical protein
LAPDPAGYDRVKLGDPFALRVLHQGCAGRRRYAPDNPHAARITGQARTHYWRTTLGVYADDAVTLAGLGALVVVGAGIFQVAQRGKAQARHGRKGKESHETVGSSGTD